MPALLCMLTHTHGTAAIGSAVCLQLAAVCDRSMHVPRQDMEQQELHGKDRRLAQKATYCAGRVKH